MRGFLYLSAFSDCVQPGLAGERDSLAATRVPDPAHLEARRAFELPRCQFHRCRVERALPALAKIVCLQNEGLVGQFLLAALVDENRSDGLLAFVGLLALRGADPLDGVDLHSARHDAGWADGGLDRASAIGLHAPTGEFCRDDELRHLSHVLSVDVAIPLVAGLVSPGRTSLTVNRPLSISAATSINFASIGSLLSGLGSTGTGIQ